LGLADSSDMIDGTLPPFLRLTIAYAACRDCFAAISSRSSLTSLSFFMNVS
jgi:hypothetical protein